MSSTRHPGLKLRSPVSTVFLDRLQGIFARMDRQYAETAARYGFRCDGCGDNCCRTRFYHHTYLEYLFIQHGLETLDSHVQRHVKMRAEKICRAFSDTAKELGNLHLMCPLNDEDRCILYEYRPMICRLHGIPHQLQKPGQAPVYGPGCGMFERHCAGKGYCRFDRTLFYSEMARLEYELRQAAGLETRLKMTIAEMIAGK